VGTLARKSRTILKSRNLHRRKSAYNSEEFFQTSPDIEEEMKWGVATYAKGKYYLLR